MPDKPMTPEEFANHVWIASINFEVNRDQSIKWLVDFVTARDESIRREVKREERNDICRWLSGDCTWPEGKQLAEDIQYMSAEAEALKAIDMPPSADRAPEAVCPRCGSNQPMIRGFMFGTDYPTDRCPDLFHPANREVKCGTCNGEGRTIQRLPMSGDYVETCPACHGTGKRGAQ